MLKEMIELLNHIYSQPLQTQDENELKNRVIKAVLECELRSGTLAQQVTSQP